MFLVLFKASFDNVFECDRNLRSVFTWLKALFTMQKAFTLVEEAEMLNNFEEYLLFLLTFGCFFFSSLPLGDKLRRHY